MSAAIFVSKSFLHSHFTVCKKVLFNRTFGEKLLIFNNFPITSGVSIDWPKRNWKNKNPILHSELERKE